VRRSHQGGWRLKVTAAALAVLAITAGWHYWTLASSLTSARSELLAAAVVVDDAGIDIQQNDMAIFELHVDAASRAINRAARHYRWDPVITISRVVPGVGQQTSAVGHFIKMGQLLTTIGQESAEAGSHAIAMRDERERETALSGSIAELLLETGPAIERIDSLTRALVAERLALGDRELIGPLDAARRRLDAQLPELAEAVAQGARAQALLPGFLGYNGERRYLILALNNGELMPGGGLVTAGGVVTMTEGSNGPVHLSDSTGWKKSWEAMGGEYISPPGPLQRYLLHDYTWNLLVSNWNPDFPTWSQQALEFYELVHGPQQVDGIIALDLVVLERLLQITGPKTLEVPGHGAVTFDTSNAVIELERLTRQPSETSGDRKSVIGDLSEELLRDIQALPPERWRAVLDVVRALGDERHVQILSFVPTEQALIRETGWSGHIQSTSGDYVHFSEGSVNSTKLNLIMTPDATYRIDLDNLGDARHTLELRYSNTLPEWQRGKDPALVKQLMLGGLYGGYLRIFGPESMTGLKAAVNETLMALEDRGADNGKRWGGIFMPLASGQQATVRFSWAVPLATDRPDRYELFIQKQPGTTGMCIDLLVTKEGVPAAQVEVQGGRQANDGRVCLVTDISIRATFP
jgi:hypothetical protein